MIPYHHLQKGLLGLAQAHRANTMAGHLGAAVVAGYFIGEDFSDLYSEASASIKSELDRIMRGDEALWFDQEKAGLSIPQLFSPGPQSKKQGDPTKITQALAQNIGTMRASGHNVIFAALALRGLQDHPSEATEDIVSGIEKLIKGFNKSGPGRGYYGKERGWINATDIVAANELTSVSYGSEAEMVERVVNELIKNGSRRRRGFGGLFHLINHTAALISLSQLGFNDLALAGMQAHRHHLELIQRLPDLSTELGILVRSTLSPKVSKYWELKNSTQWSGWLTHRIKTIYGFHTLLDWIDEPSKKRKAEEQFLYLMA
ncbi:hypothetical protein N8737_04240 [Verrucomicrobia bacterium]|nr:hypothetical protein [Verrucomicrobiota bacterium]MDA7657891.1 hypothetical protein [Verrucomicrobiota bacterium]